MSRGPLHFKLPPGIPRVRFKSSPGRTFREAPDSANFVLP